MTEELVALMSHGPTDERASVGFTVVNGELTAGLAASVFLTADAVDIARRGAADRRLSLPQLSEKFTPALLDPQSFRSVHQSIRVKASTDQAMRADWTEPGRAESERVRGEHPDRLAHQFRRIRDELLEQTGRATHPEIAELANAQGLLTSRGRPIRADTVSRALKRLDPE